MLLDWIQMLRNWPIEIIETVSYLLHYDDFFLSEIAALVYLETYFFFIFVIFFVKIVEIV